MTNNEEVISREDLDILNFKHKSALKVLKTNISILLEEYEVQNGEKKVEHVNTRIKSIDSAINKLKKKNYDINVDNLEKHVKDMVGIRLVCPFIDDVYDMVELIKNSDILQVVEEKDYNKNPKKSGYKSYHIKVLVPVVLRDEIEYVPAEIQVRTLIQDAWAALEHKMRYKNKYATVEDSKNLQRIAQELSNIEDEILDIKSGQLNLENESKILIKK